MRTSGDDPNVLDIPDEDPMRNSEKTVNLSSAAVEVEGLDVSDIPNENGCLKKNILIHNDPYETTKNYPDVMDISDASDKNN